ncbi:hypothetical protein Hanom_Chr07g00627761 [Helianthus anomalus]
MHPPGYMTLYAAFFQEGNFRLPITRFTADVLRNYGLHLSQINAIGLPRITHFEFICMANRVEPTFEMFSVFYTVTYTSGFYSFNSRTGVAPVCYVPLKSLHDWKHKFFYIRWGVIPMDMHYRSVDDGISKIDVLFGFAEQSWYKKITHKATAISQLEEMALVGAGMSLLWVPKNPLGVLVYGYNGKLGYSLLNVLDPKAAGAMVEAIQEDGKPTWLEQICPRFLHPTNDSFVTYANVVLGEPDEDDPVGPTREEVVVLSSGSSGRSFGDLTSRSTRAGHAKGVVNDPAQETVFDDDDVPVDPSAQLETGRKTKTDTPGKGEKRVEGETVGISRKRPSTLPFLDYVVVSDTLSGLGTREKSRGSDPDDRATLTEMMRKKALEEKKRKPYEQAAAQLASKKARLQKEALPAPSESEIDMVIFSEERGNLLEEIFDASAPTGVKSSKGPRRVDISKITPPTSHPSRTIDLSPPRDDSSKKKKEDEATAERAGEGGDGVAGGDNVDQCAGGDGGGGKGKGVDVEVESSETTPHQTIYTKRPPGGGGASSGVVRSPQFENVRADSWDTHNPACDDLPHVPRWNLTQGSRMNIRRNRFELLDDHVHAGVKFFATSQEIVREWRVMGDETYEFEAEKKAFVEEREKFNAKKKGLMWRVSDAEEKLSHEKQVNATK